jgi:hypothetical protein
VIDMAKKKSMTKSKKSKAKSAKKKTAKRPTTKATKASKAKKSKKSKKTVRAAAKKSTRKMARKPAKGKKQIVGEGSYEGTRAFDKDQSSFVKRNKDRIPALGKEAEAALEGPEGDALREAEATAAARSRDTF